MDSYQAIYDAVRTKISACNPNDAILQAFREANLLHSFSVAMQDISYSQTRPSVLYRPAVSIDGDKWCALYGEDLQNGVAGFGDSPEEAMADFDREWAEKLRRSSTRAAE